ncbi:uncharacterized protein LOC129592575 [Paramacrobiotus metropolitanus]|uniref:uncharacterized protein LOC129592575 n=1 Tax=Paramacrobiotus metropolitanus TaxID=2943436 RepID=UPI00244626E6|nr:uncharacterized protein LOC129592575 [Paramacrobiotus metropolitanus]
MGLAQAQSGILNDWNTLYPFYLTANGVLGHAVMAPHMFILMLVFFLSTCFKQLACEIGRSATKPGIFPADFVQKFRQYTGVLRYFNGTFGYLLLFSCVQDLVEVVSMIAWALRPITERDAKEDLETFAIRMEINRTGDLFRYLTGSMQIATMLIRLCILIKCNEKVKRVKRELEVLRDETGIDEETDLFIAKFVMEIDTTRTTAVSAGGFFCITREYLVTIVGVLLTYFILLYQTHDSGRDMQALLKTEVFTTQMNAVLRNITAGILEFRK